MISAAGASLVATVGAGLASPAGRQMLQDLEWIVARDVSWMLIDNTLQGLRTAAGEGRPLTP